MLFLHLSELYSLLADAEVHWKTHPTVAHKKACEALTTELDPLSTSVAEKAFALDQAQILYLRRQTWPDASQET